MRAPRTTGGSSSASWRRRICTRPRSASRSTIADRSPVAIGVLRELARTTRDLPLEEGLRREADGFRRCLASEDGAEGVAAFLEKREPQFSGR